MVLLQPIVQVCARSMLPIAPHCLANSSGIGTVPIGGHLVGNLANDCNCPLEKALSCLHIPLLTSHGISQIAILINCPIKITPFPFDFEIGLIHIPGLPCLSASFGSQVLCNEWSKPRFPLPNCLVSKLPAAPQKYFGEVSQAQLVSSRHRTTRRTTSMGYSKKLHGVPSKLPGRVRNGELVGKQVISQMCFDPFALRLRKERFFPEFQDVWALSTPAEKSSRYVRPSISKEALFFSRECTAAHATREKLRVSPGSCHLPAASPGQLLRQAGGLICKRDHTNGSSIANRYPTSSTRRYHPLSHGLVTGTLRLEHASRNKRPGKQGAVASHLQEFRYTYPPVSANRRQLRD